MLADILPDVKGLGGNQLLAQLFMFHQQNFYAQSLTHYALIL